MASSNTIPPGHYFDSLARSYARQTGNSTRAAFALSLDAIASSITPSSVIHDNAGGLSTATSVIVESRTSASHNNVPEILITDKNSAMVAAARETFNALAPKITAAELDS